jgi:hypothetical protein
VPLARNDRNDRAGDYLKSNWQVANMETANYNARRAANAIIEKSGSIATPAVTIEPYRPAEWEPFKSLDEDRYRRGLPNLLDPVDPIPRLKQLEQLLATGLAALPALL